MQTGLLAVVLAYFFISIIGIGWLVSKKQKNDDNFLLASRSLNWQVLSITLALTILGTPHIFGLFEWQ
jgi:SSS family solute:Na+ symporter